MCSEPATVFETLFQALLFASCWILTTPAWSGIPSLCPSQRQGKYTAEFQMDTCCRAAGWSWVWVTSPFQNWISWFVLVFCSPPVTTKCYNFICLWIVLSSHFWGSHHLKPDRAIVVSQFSESQASVSGFKPMCDEISAPTLLTCWYSSRFQKMVHVGQQLFIYCCGNICSHSISTYKGTL